MFAQRQNESQRRSTLILAAVLLPLLALYLLLIVTARPALSSGTLAKQSGPLGESGIVVTPTAGLITTEAGGTAVFRVVLSSQPTATVALTLATSDASEGFISLASLTFLTTTWNVTQTVTVTGVNDDVDDGNQSYMVLTGAATSSDPSYAGLNPPNVSVLNQDNDTAGINLNNTGDLETTETGVTDTFTIVLASEPTANVTIGLSSNDTTEGTISPNSITFTPANWDTARTVTLTGVDDDVDDGDQSYAAVTAAADSGDPLYDEMNAANPALTNIDNDTAGINVNPTSGLVTTEEDTGSDDFTVVLNSEPTANVSFDLSSSDTGEGTVSPASLTFTAANWDTPRTVTVTGVDEAIDDGDQEYTINTAAATSGDSNYNGMNPADVQATNIDDDGVGFSLDPLTDLVTSEAGGTDSFTVRLNSQPTAAVTIGFSSNDTGEGTVAPATLTFQVSNWNTPQTVTMTGVDDDEDDGDVAYVIETSPATSGDPNYNGQNPADATVTNTDNDAAAFLIEPTVPLTTTEDGDSDTFRVRLNAQPIPDTEVQLPLSSSDLTEGTISAASLLFTRQNWNAWQTVTVTGVDDEVVDGDQPYAIYTAPAVSDDPAYNTLNPPDLPAINLDRDSRLYLPVVVTIPTPPEPVWEKIGNEPAGVTKFYAVATCGNESFSGANNGLYRLAGNTWQQQAAVPSLFVFGLAFTGDCSAVYAGTYGQGTWRGVQSGNTWNWTRVDTLTQTNDDQVWAVVIHNGTVYVGAEHGLFWASLPTQAQAWNLTNITGLAGSFSQNEDGTIYTAVWGEGVYQAGPNPGDNWTEVGSIADTLVYQAAQTSNGARRVAGTQTQIFRWNGSNWQAVNSSVERTFAVTAYDGQLFAGQRNNGVLVSNDGGQTWVAMNDEMAMPAGEEFQVRGFFVDGDGYLYAATTSGVWRWSLSLDE